MLPHSGSDYQCDSNIYRNKINSCARKRKYYIQVSQSSATSLVKSPDSTLAFAHNSQMSKILPALLSGNKAALSDSEAMMHKLHALKTALMGPDSDDEELSEVINEKTGSWREILNDFLHDRQGGPYLHDLAAPK